MAVNDTGNLLERVLIVAGGAISVWAARHYGWLKKRNLTEASHEQHVLEIAVSERGKTIEGLWLLISDARKEISELRGQIRDLRVERVAEEDRTRLIIKERDAANSEVRQRDQLLAVHERTIAAQKLELDRFLERFADQDMEIAELKARIVRLEQKLRDSGLPTNGH